MADSGKSRALDKNEIIRKIYTYMEQKAISAYNDGEDEFFVGHKMLVRELGIEMTDDGTFCFAGQEEEEGVDISFYDEKAVDFMYKVGRLLMRKHPEKIKQIELKDEMLRIVFS
jgi:hypothetical protein